MALWWFLSLFLFSHAPAEKVPPPPKALFISVIQEPPVLSSRAEIDEVVAFSKKAGVTTLFVQVYRANKAWFPSKVADDTPYNACLKSVGEDPFALLIQKAHAEGIEVHAWMNLMSLSANTDAPLLKKYGPEILTRNAKPKKSLEDYKIDNQYFLEPGDPRVRQTLVTAVGEIVRTYPGVDGVQFDYIRYPDSHPAYGWTRVNLSRFKHATGLVPSGEDSPAWRKWKRDQVTSTLVHLIKKARSIKPAIQVSTTGLIPFTRAREEAFQDWRAWLDGGIVDFVTLMCYAGDTQGFKRQVVSAHKKVSDWTKVNIAVGAYKLTAAPRTFRREFDFCEEAGPRACVVLHYGNLLENPALEKPLLNEK